MASLAFSGIDPILDPKSLGNPTLGNQGRDEASGIAVSIRILEDYLQPFPCLIMMLRMEGFLSVFGVSGFDVSLEDLEP